MVPCADVDRGLMRQQQERVCDPVPGLRLAEQDGEIDAVAGGGDAVESVVDVDGR